MQSVSTPSLCMLFKRKLMYSGNEHLSKRTVTGGSHGSHCWSGRLQKGKSGEEWNVVMNYFLKECELMFSLM